MNYIRRANLNIFNGLLAGAMDFSPGLNIISGENGTLKTKLLQTLKAGLGQQHPGGAFLVEVADPQKPLRIQAINPKRNSERRQIAQIVQMFRQQNRTLDTTINERLTSQINDQGFENYSSLGELFYLTFDHRCRDGGDRKHHLEEVTTEFNSVVQSIFSNYAMISEWDVNDGVPKVFIRKAPAIDFPIEGLSLGEQEILSLTTNISTARNHVDVFLIDEPEVHLNWHLEERLFDFLHRICGENEKQMIVVTHSRTIFRPKYLACTQFLYWNPAGRISWNRELSAAQQKRLAGDAIEIIRLGNFRKPTFFVEDRAHNDFLNALAWQLGVEVSVIECGNSANVKSLYKHSVSEGGWANSYFLVDGDNQGNSFPASSTFVHLPVYCIQNYLLLPELVAEVTGRSLLEIQELFVASILGAREKIFTKNKFFEFLVDQLRPEAMVFDRLKLLDASLIFDDILNRLGLKQDAYLKSYFATLSSQNRIQQILPPELLTSMQSALTGRHDIDSGAAAAK